MSSGAPIEHGTPVRYPAVALMCVDSEDGKEFDTDKYRIDSNRPSQIYINRQRPVMFGYMTRLALTEMNIQWDTPNVNNLNNTLTIRTWSGVDASGNPISTGYHRITIDADFYTQSELATEVQTALTDLSGATGGLTFQVTFDTSSLGFTIVQTALDPSGNVKGYFSIVPGDAPQSLTGLPSKQYDLLYMMGFEALASLKNTYYSILYGAYAPMIYTPYIDVVSNLLTKNQNVSDGSTSKRYTGSKLARIYFSNEYVNNRATTDVSGNETIGIRPCKFRREFITPKQIQWNNTENVDIVDIQVLDYKGNPITIEDEYTEIPETGIGEIAIVQKSNTAFQFTIQITEI